MTRSLSANNQSAVADSVVRPIFLIEMQFDSAPVYLWNGFGDLSWDSKTWLGAGQVLNISEVQESYDLRASGFTVSLSGLQIDRLDDAINEDYQNRKVFVRQGFLDDDGNLVADPYILISGRMDVMTISEEGETSVIQISVENRLIDFERSRRRTYTDQDQKLDYPNDKGFEYVAAIQDIALDWGKG